MTRGLVRKTAWHLDREHHMNVSEWVAMSNYRANRLVCDAADRAMQVHGLIVADNGSDMFVSGTMDARWNNDVLNPAFASLAADDFEVVQLGWHP